MPDGCLVTDPPPGVELIERVCDRSGERVVHFQEFIPGDPALRTPGWWQWTCTGLTADEREAGKL